jgi:hypothetical protein
LSKRNTVLLLIDEVFSDIPVETFLTHLAIVTFIWLITHINVFFYGSWHIVSLS